MGLCGEGSVASPDGGLVEICGSVELVSSGRFLASGDFLLLFSSPESLGFAPIFFVFGVKNLYKKVRVFNANTARSPNIANQGHAKWYQLTN